MFNTIQFLKQNVMTGINWLKKVINRVKVNWWSTTPWT